MNIKYRRELWKLLSVCGDAAEIGVAEGYFSRDILDMPHDFPRVFMVDAWQTLPQKGDASNPQDWHDKNFREAKARVKPFGSRAVPLRGLSVEMSKKVLDQSLALLYIDGDHTYRGVIADLEAWVPKVMPDGVVGLHDFENTDYGVKAAATDFCKRHGFKLNPIPEDKLEDAGAWFRVC